jgi:hypothetical protein
MALSAFKVIQHELPLSPTEEQGPWQVELTVTVRGDGQRGSVRAMLPRSEAGQRIFDERASSDRLDWEVQDRESGRAGLWSGWLEGVHEVVYRFRVQSSAVDLPLRAPEVPSEVSRSLRSLYLKPSATIPSTAPTVQAQIADLDLPPPTDLAARIQTVFSFATHEIATERTAAADVLLTLERREGNPDGKERLLVTLFRAAGVPARLSHGLELADGARPEARVWAEAWLGGAWIPASSVEGWIGRRPADWIVMGRGTLAAVEASGARAVGHRYRALREHLRPDEIASLMAPDDPILSFLSLYRLPVGSQSLLHLLLLLPVGALITALFRNLIGVRSYGTFMPALIALALRDLTPPVGLALVGGVLLLGVSARFWLERLRLLMVPRLSILLCIVVLCVTAIALTSASLGSRDWLAGAAMPIVILTMWIERITITIEEEGIREAGIRVMWSLVIAASILPVYQSEQISYLMFTFPELVLAIMGALVWVGGYTGFRVIELLRFRELGQEELSS